MTFTILYIIVIHLILPFIFIYSLWRGSFGSKLEWLLELLTTVVFVVWVFQAGSWDWVSYYLRFVWLALLIVAVICSWKKTRALPFRTTFNSKQKLSMGIYAVLLLVFGLYNVFVFSSYTTNEQGIALTFPLNNGTYYVGQGGSHVQMNYHHTYPPQKYALDIVKLNQFGTRAGGLYPKELGKYAIYDDELYSPCNGEVLETRDDLPDLTPPNTDPERPEGNYVALSCENIDAVVYIAHMQEGSVTIEKGGKVTEGQMIGKVGNSGNTTEPHLHIHAEKDGVGVPIRFDDRFLVRNSLVR